MQNDIQTRAGNYISRIFSIAGDNGSTAALLAAGHLVRGFAIPIPDAKRILAAWNETNADPKWTDQELDRKLAEALEKGRMETGCHLRDDDRHQQRNRAPYRPRPDAPATGLADDEKSRRKAAERAAVMASLRLPTASEMEIIAELRRVSIKAVLYLTQDGFLKVGQWRSGAVFAIQSGDFAQIRRMDGDRFWEGGPKELNMAEPTPAFIVSRNSSPDGTRTIIAEGLVELLSLTELEIRAEEYRRTHFPDIEYQPVAFAVASSAGSKIDDIALESLRCKSIRIIPDNDPAGHKAAQHWTERILAAGIHIDNLLMPVGKDLGEALPAMPDAACYHLLQF
ncbi:MAG: toprim domain-containing protein [Verrucomicrobiota bacterium]